jgi:hypothetical protein
MEEPYLLPEVTKLNPWVSMATPVRWTCSSTYQLIKEDFPAEWFPEVTEKLVKKLMGERKIVCFPISIFFPMDNTTMLYLVPLLRQLRY